MPVDFDALVLNVCEDVFGIPITIVPLKSQRNSTPYAARGIWTAEPYTVMLENNAPLTTSIYKLGIRLKDFAIPPVAGDHVLINGNEYIFDDPDADGQGGVEWIMKATAAGAEAPQL
jgi:hypothetical protein